MQVNGIVQINGHQQGKNIGLQKGHKQFKPKNQDIANQG
jgi:hypothetical protein